MTNKIYYLCNKEIIGMENSIPMRLLANRFIGRESVPGLTNCYLVLEDNFAKEQLLIETLKGNVIKRINFDLDEFKNPSEYNTLFDIHEEEIVVLTEAGRRLKSP